MSSPTKPVTRGAIYTFSMGMLMTMGVGLGTGVAGYVSLDKDSDQHAKDIEVLKAKAALVDQIATDVAVIRSKVEMMAARQNRDR